MASSGMAYHYARYSLNCPNKTAIENGEAITCGRLRQRKGQKTRCMVRGLPEALGLSLVSEAQVMGYCIKSGYCGFGLSDAISFRSFKAATQSFTAL